MSEQHHSEIWKSVVGYEGYYEVSTHGRVRSVDRTIPDKRWGMRRQRGRVLKSSQGSNGYQVISLSMHNDSASQNVHRLVLKAFVGPPFDGAVAMHIDNDPNNNSIGNLQWGTQAQNNKQMRDEDRAANLKGESVGSSKLTNGEVLEIRMLYAKGDMTQKELGHRFGVSDPLICLIVNRKRWKHI